MTSASCAHGDGESPVLTPNPSPHNAVLQEAEAAWSAASQIRRRLDTRASGFALCQLRSSRWDNVARGLGQTPLRPCDGGAKSRI